MSVPKFAGEKEALKRFLALYLLSTLLLLGVGLYIFYIYSLHRIIDHQNERLKLKTTLLVPKLRNLHISNKKRLVYPVIDGIHTALYDIDRNFLIGDFRPQKIYWDKEFWQEDGMLYYRKSIEPYYIGTATIIAAAPIDRAPIETLQKRVALAFGAAILFIFLIARWLGKLFLAPVKQTLQLLDRFIQDTAHELNTPVSTIVMNIELFKTLHPEFEHSDELRRIDSAAKRLSRLYDDLVYLLLHHQRRRNVEKIAFDKLLKERMEYFASIAMSKNIILQSIIEPEVYHRMDREDAAKLIDNIVSNAIKYTRSGGKIVVRLQKRFFEVEDNGVGMDPQKLKRVTERFFRADKSTGGFGLGLNIVQEIAKVYNLDLQIQSKKNIGTKVRIVWQE